MTSEADQPGASREMVLVDLQSGAVHSGAPLNRAQRRMHLANARKEGKRHDK